MPTAEAWAQSELMAKVARLYCEQGATQSDIARRLNVSQAKVSRLLARARAEGIIRTMVVSPPEVYGEEEEMIREAFGLLDAVVVAEADDGVDPTVDLGRRAAPYLQATLGGSGPLGVSSWSATLLAAAEALGRTSDGFPEVVQLIGGHGDPATQARSMRLLTLLSDATGAVPVGMPAPGTLTSPAGRDALMSDAAIAQVAARWNSLSTAIVGIGSVNPSPMLRDSGNAWDLSDAHALIKAGAVGDICLRFFDRHGTPVTSSVDDRVLGIDLATFKDVPRRIAIAGGADKESAIRAALIGGWINVLVTDAATARLLLAPN